MCEVLSTAAGFYTESSCTVAVMAEGFSNLALPRSFISRDHELFILVPAEPGSGRSCVNVYWVSE